MSEINLELSQSAFTDLIQRVRGGDERAAADLVKRYEPQIRREIRLRLRDSRLRRALDSMDICQSVLASFFTRATAGDYDLENPQSLIRLLAGMARHKVAGAAQHQNAQKRDARRIAVQDLRSLEVPGPDVAPYLELDARDLIDRWRSRLSDEERSLLDLRLEGHEWSEIASRLGGAPAARRMQFRRALTRIGAEHELSRRLE